MISVIRMDVQKILSHGVGKELISMGLEEMRAGVEALSVDEAVATIRETKEKFVRAQLLIERGLGQLIDVVNDKSMLAEPTRIVSTPQDRAVIKALLKYKDGGVRQNVIAQDAGVAESNLSKILHKLRGEGLITGKGNTLRPTEKLLLSSSCAEVSLSE